ncbi:MAG: gliding motility-associated C-terminal domain-containing protein [Flavobacteriales bacterium]|nr:gliding motility-associated C-terminal domain-containing protein [Flavobacteriales bacterium]
MRSIFKFFLPVILLLMGYSSVKATHVAGADITYECIGTDSFLVRLNVFADCGGTPFSSTTETIDISSSCFTGPLILSLLNPGGTEISQLCAADQGSSTCNGGSLPGMLMYTFEGIIELQPCADYVFGWSLCCRNTSLTFGTAEPTFYVQAEMNSIEESCNTSPFFTAQPIPYVCANQQVSYNFGVTEVDGDSVYYQFISAQSGLGIDIAYDAPYTPAQPIASGIALDSITGLLVFTPQQLGNLVIVVEVQEFDDQGNLIGSVIRDIQFIVQTCTNQVPSDTLGVIQNLIGSATVVDDYSIILCDGESFSFDIVVSDPDNDSLTLTSNVELVLPGATFTVTNGNPATATISWIATGGNNFNNAFVIFADDDVCPIPGIQSYVYNVKIQESTVASEDVIVVCGQQIADLSVQGGDNFVWTALPGGDTINSGVNFGCDSCDVTWADPDSTTFYQVVSDLTTSGCANTDTVKVTVVPDFDYVMTQSDTNVCLLGGIDFTVTPDSVASYYYDWYPTSYFDVNDTTGTVEGIIGAADTSYVTFVLTSDWGCVKTDAFLVIASQNVQPLINLFGDSTVCQGNTASFFAVDINAIPIECDTYIVQSITFAPLTGPGTAVNLFDDELSAALPIGFDFNFFCDTFQTFYISSNGFITFDSGEGPFPLTGQVLPDPLSANNLIAFAWEDLDPNGSVDGTIEYFTTGTSPNQILVINFIDVPHYGAGGNVTVQLLIYEDGSDIEIHTTSQPDAAGFHTMGIENSDGTVGFAAPGRNGQSWTATNDAYRFSKPILPSSFVWSWTSTPLAFFSSTDSSFVNYFPSDDTSLVMITIRDTIGGRVDTALMNLYVVDSFSVATYISETDICLYGEFEMSVTPSNDSPYNFTWLNTAYLSSSTDSVVTADTVGTSGWLTYVVETANLVGCERLDTFRIQVSEGPQPVITIFGDSTMCLGDSTLLQTSICPNSPISNLYCLEMYDDFGDGWNDAYLQLWLDDTLAQDSLFSQFPHGTGPYGQFCIEITEGTIIELKFFNGPSDQECSYYLVNMGDTSITTDDDTLFSDGAGGANPLVGLAYSVCANSGSIVSPTLAYSWTQIGTISTPTNDSTYVYPLSNETYQVVVVDAVGGCTDSATFNVLVVPSFEPVVTASDTAICLSTDATFTLTTVPAAASDYTYVWGASPYLTDFTESSVTTTNITQFGNVEFNYTISSPTGCDKEGTVAVFVSAGIQPNIQAYSDTTCVGQNIAIDPTMIGLSLTGDSCQLTLNMYDTFGDGWNGGNLDISVNGNTNNYTLADGTDSTITFNIGVTDSICLAYEEGGFAYEVSYALYNQDNVLLFSDGANVDGFDPDTGLVWCSVQVCGLSDATYVYEWSPGATLTSDSTKYTVASPESTTTYQLIATDTIGYCADTADVEVVVSPAPAFTASSSGGICINEDPITLQVDVQGGAWSGPGITDVTAGTFNPAMAGIGSSSVLYSITIAGCTGDTTITVDVFGIPLAPSVVTNSPYCELDSLDNISATGAGGSLFWYEYNQTTEIGSGNSLDLGIAEQSDTIFVNETLNGCVGPFTAVVIDVVPIPVVSFTATPEQGYIPFEVAVTNTSASDTINYAWNFGNGDSSGEQNPEDITYTETGNFLIILVGTDANGCQSRDTLMIDSDDKIYVPKVFSPNGDNKNDKFRVSGFPEENFECFIYNRWGLQLFEFTNPNTHFWDGGNQASGTYFVVINYTDWNEQSAQYATALTLLKEKQ